MKDHRHANTLPTLRRRVAVLLLLAGTPGLAVVDTADPVPTSDKPLLLKTLVVNADGSDPLFDRTGMGGLDSEYGEPPFSNDLLSGANTQDEAGTGIEVEIQRIAMPNTADLSVGNARLDIRGFPTPRLRNGFVQNGIPEVLNTERIEQIAGALVPVTGRAAPGGINNQISARPRAKDSGSAGLSLSSLDAARAFVDDSRRLRPGNLWMRSSLSVQRKDGPEVYSRLEQGNLGWAMTWKPSTSSSLMLQADYYEAQSNPSGGVPEYKLTRKGVIQGPWLPLGLFHTNGPEGGQQRRAGSLSLQYEAQPSSTLSLRGSLQGFARSFEEQRFTRGEYLVDEGVFSGTREPLHMEQPLEAVSAGGEATLRLDGLGARHKLSLAADFALSQNEREQRALPKEQLGELLPPDVLRFDPDTPNWYAPVYSEALYSRILTSRREQTGYAALRLSERAAFNQGRTVATAGLRADSLTLTINDASPRAPRARIEDDTGRSTWHAGLNQVLVPGKLLLFVNTSTAYEPSLRIDARTGRIQGNESTLGYEAGATSLLASKSVSLTAHFFRYFNQNIARRNPLYENPLLDADHTQPQLVASGEERFQGGVLELKWKATKSLQVSGQLRHTDAITTASPDLPEEVGRQLSKLPRDTAGLNLRFAPTEGPLAGFWAGMSGTYIGSYTAWYESKSRIGWTYDDYALVGASTGLRWVRKPCTHTAGLSVRNLLDEDLLALQARPGQEREFSLSYTLGY